MGVQGEDQIGEAFSDKQSARTWVTNLMRNARRRDGTSQIMSRFRDASLHGEERSHGACLGDLTHRTPLPHGAHLSHLSLSHSALEREGGTLLLFGGRK